MIENSRERERERRSKVMIWYRSFCERLNKVFEEEMEEEEGSRSQDGEGRDGGRSTSISLPFPWLFSLRVLIPPPHLIHPSILHQRAPNGSSLSHLPPPSRDLIIVWFGDGRGRRGGGGRRSGILTPNVILYSFNLFLGRKIDGKSTQQNILISFLSFRGFVLYHLVFRPQERKKKTR